MDNSEWFGWVGYALSPAWERGTPGTPAIQGFRNFRKTLYDSGESGPPQHHATRHPDPSGSVRLTTRTVLGTVVGRGGVASTSVAFGSRLERPIQGFRNFRNSLYSHGQNRLQTRGRTDFPTQKIFTSDLYMFCAPDYQFSGAVVRAWKKNYT